MFRFHRKFIRALIACASCAGAALVCPSCSLDPEIVSVFGGELSVPKLLSLETVSGREVRAVFSSPVTVSGAGVALRAGTAEITSSWEEESDSGKVAFVLDEPVGIGERAILSATVTDARGDSLSFSVPFSGYNDHPAKLRINEVRVDYSKPKVEFIEFVAVSAGNLAGIEIQNANNAARPSWEFPSVEVREGDIIVYHLRSIEDGVANETGALDDSSGVDARTSARDFWDTLDKAPLKDTNVILIRERKLGTILDALLLASPDATAWPNKATESAAADACAAGAWKGDPTVANAVSSRGMTTTRTLGRNPGSADTDSAADWKACAKGKASPGAPNSQW